MGLGRTRGTSRWPSADWETSHAFENIKKNSLVCRFFAVKARENISTPKCLAKPLSQSGQHLGSNLQREYQLGKGHKSVGTLRSDENYP
ncbi:jg16900 [Pararge aegeria aegeria]|uniref:Jg16900 protein n=1 Tax=Pararge aegeria aegeria TaxID=348720 RepID=A0A8S4SHV5_9NEOP|nr:jg16900 [Pararge aegeria aegeria]